MPVLMLASDATDADAARAATLFPEMLLFTDLTQTSLLTRSGIATTPKPSSQFNLHARLSYHSLEYVRRNIKTVMIAKAFCLLSAYWIIDN